MDTQKTSDLTVADILLQHIRQNATLPMAWSLEENCDELEKPWTLTFEHPSGAGAEEVSLNANTRWLGVTNTIRTIEDNYRALESNRLGLPSTHREVAA